LVKERAKKAQEMINKEIEETTILLHACDIKIGELQSKLETVQEIPEREQHEEELNKLKAKRTRRALQKQKSIEEKKLIDEELD